jgi:hypothetical protein
MALGHHQNDAEHDKRDEPRPILIRCRAGSMIGLPDMRPSSLAKAMIEPVKVIAPMATPSAISIRATAFSDADFADAERLRRVKRGGGHEHGGQADEEWNAATSCGIAVIGMRLAMTAPMPPPMADAEDEQTDPMK